VLAYVLAFVVGAVFEGLYLGWVMAASRGYAGLAAAFSVATGAASLYGVTSTVHDPSKAPALLLGYGVGSYLIVRWTDRKPGAKNTG
jgi:hypothetical protein